MSKIIVEASSSYVAEDAVMALLKGGFVAKTARISYNLNKGLPPVEDTDNYPLILEGVFGLSPVRIHKAAGFKFDESDILTARYTNAIDKIELTYTR